MKDTLRTLGLRVGQSVVREDAETVCGAIHTVRHLVTVEEVDLTMADSTKNTVRSRVVVRLHHRVPPLVQRPRRPASR